LRETLPLLEAAGLDAHLPRHGCSL
jgi:hypothetical protein